MGRLANALLLVVALEMSMIIFTGIQSNDTSLMLFLLQPQLWVMNLLPDWLFGTIIGLGGAAIIIGSFFSRSDWVWRMTLAAVFVTFGFTVAHFNTFIRSQAFLGSSNEWVAAFATIPLMLYFVVTIIDFINAKD